MRSHSPLDTPHCKFPRNCPRMYLCNRWCMPLSNCRCMSPSSYHNSRRQLPCWLCPPTWLQDRETRPPGPTCLPPPSSVGGSGRRSSRRGQYSHRLLFGLPCLLPFSHRLPAGLGPMCFSRLRLLGRLEVLLWNCSIYRHIRERHCVTPPHVFAARLTDKCQHQLPGISSWTTFVAIII